MTRHITSAKMSYRQLVCLDKAESTPVESVLKILRRYTCGEKEPEQAKKLGTLNAYLDDDGHLHLDFVSDISLQSEPVEEMFTIINQPTWKPMVLISQDLKLAGKSPTFSQ